MTITTRLEVLDPTVEPVPAHTIIARRPETLDGAVLGLLANGKANSVDLLSLVHEVLADRYEFKGVVARNKGNASRPCPSELIEEMTDQCDVVISASGD